MTNRRSMQGYSQRVSRALQFQPGHVGGRVASAQPVLHRNRIGAAGVAAVPPTFVGMDKNAAGSPGVDAEFYAAIGVIAAGDPVLVFAFGHGTVAAPAGWTTLASGTVTNMGYVVAWVPFAGSVDGSGNYAGALDITFPCSDTAQLLTTHWHGGTATPTATAYESPATNTANAPATPLAAAPWSVVGIEWDSGWSSSGMTTSAPTYSTYQVSRTYSVVQGTTEPGIDTGGSAITLGGSGSPSPDLVSVMLGWT